MELFRWIGCLGLALAFIAPAKAADEDWTVMCKKWSDMGAAIMRNRQHGVSMADAVAHKTGNDYVDKVVMALSVAAYEKPRFDSPEYQGKAITDFSNDTYLACAKSHMK